MKIKKGDKVRIITGKDKYRADNKETYEHEVLALLSQGEPHTG